ncbi:hypothetical protein LQZ21_13835 [Treponema sp. TIM-1]|uniref:hypothetical protein n=1 Tax=Treponema sp. TIM-1 TaxID=2898417 RepID=UPI00398073D0
MKDFLQETSGNKPGFAEVTLIYYIKPLNKKLVDELPTLKGGVAIFLVGKSVHGLGTPLPLT